MKISDYLIRHQEVQGRSRWQQITILGLLGTNGLSSGAMWLRSEPVILVPPDLAGEVEIARNHGSGSLKESWGLYLAELLGNVTPGNARFIERSIGSLLDSKIYPEVMGILATEVEALKMDRVSVKFRSSEVLYDATLDRVYVRGEQTSQGPGSAPESRPRTYEFTISFRHYRPVIEHIDVYAGDPHLKESEHSHNQALNQKGNPS